MRRLIHALTVLLVLAVAPVAMAGGWTIVKKKTRAKHATVYATFHNVTFNIAVRFIHGTGQVVLTCQHDAIKNTETKMFGAGLHVIPNPAGANTCHAVASIVGHGRVTVDLLTQ